MLLPPHRLSGRPSRRPITSLPHSCVWERQQTNQREGKWAIFCFIHAGQARVTNKSLPDLNLGKIKNGNKTGCRKLAPRNVTLKKYTLHSTESGVKGGNMAMTKTHK